MNVAVDPLSVLAITHGTDKYGGHFYTPIYDELLRHRRNEPLRVLELGVGGYDARDAGGASLRMWADYFPRAVVVGVDVVDKSSIDFGPLASRILVRTGSQNDVAFLARLCDELGPFDVVVDDGSHDPADHVVSFEALFPRLADGGLYVIEDTQTAFWPRFGGDVGGAATMSLAARLLRALHHDEIRAVDATQAAALAPLSSSLRSVRAFHNLLIVEKGRPEPSCFTFSHQNADARRALDAINAVVAAAPTPGAMTSQAIMHAAVGDVARAAAILDDAIARFGATPDLALMRTWLNGPPPFADVARAKSAV